MLLILYQDNYFLYLKNEIEMNIKYIIIFIIIMKNYILIDGSYFVFYRVFALQIWWKNAKPDIPLENPFTNEEFVEKFKSTFTSKIIELQNWLNLLNR